MSSTRQKKNTRIKNIAGIFAIMLLVSILVMTMSVSAQSLGIPVKLGVTADPSTIEVGENTIITIRLLDENDNPVNTEVDVPVDISTDLGYVPPSLVIPAGKNSLSTTFTSLDSGIAVISVKSEGFIGGTTAILVVPIPTPTPTPTATPKPTVAVPPPVTTPKPKPSAATPTPTPEEPGFGAIVAIAGLLVVVYLLRKRR
jgi:PGF-CTERM protein